MSQVWLYIVLALSWLMLALALRFVCRYYLRYKKGDVSTQKNVGPSRKILCNTWLVSYGAGEVHLANQRHLIVTAQNKGIDFFKPHTSRHIDLGYATRHAKILQQKRGAGYWLWKPYVILRTLEQIPPNDVVLYLDSGISIVKPVVPLIDLCVDHDLILFQDGNSNRKYIKRDLLKIMDMDNNATRDAIQLCGGLVLAKNTPKTRDFIQKWLDLCENEQALTDSPSQDEYPELIDHRHDQAILTVLAMQNSELVHSLPFSKVGEFFKWHRRRKIHRSLVR